MPKKKVLVYDRMEAPVLQALKEEFDVRLFPPQEEKLDPEFIAFLREAEGVIGLAFPAQAEILDLAPKLKVISNISVGYNNFDLTAMNKRGIMGTNTPDVLNDTVADMTMGLILATARRMPELDEYVKSGQWKKSVSTELFGVDVHHKTLGIIGMGRIGHEIARRAHYGFSMDIVYHSRSRKPEAEEKFAATYESLDSLLQKSDFVCLITPLTPETEGMVGCREFQLMTNSGIFINVSRGATVVEEDLVAALQAGEIAAAGLDVYVKEPINPNHPLLKMKNVVTLPHIGTATLETEMKMAELAVLNLRTGLQDKRPPSIVNPEVIHD